VLIVGVLDAAFVESSGLRASLPDFQTVLVLKQVAVLTITPPGGGLPTVLARNPHAGSVHMAFSVVRAFEKPVTAGATVSAALLLDWPSSGTERSDQDARCGEAGGRGGRIDRSAVDLRRRRIIVGLRRV